MAAINIKSLGTFSIERCGELKLYQLPPLLNERRKTGHVERCLDMRHGVQKFKHRKMISDEEVLMSFIKKIAPEENKMKRVLNSDFACTSSLLAAIVNEHFLPEAHKNRLVINAVKRGGIIFLSQKCFDISVKSPADIKYIYSRLRFEKFMTLDEDGQEHDMGRTASKELYSKAALLSTFTGDGIPLKVFHISSCDCIDSDGKLVDCKTKNTTAPLHKSVYSLRWFMESFFAGISRIAIGTYRVEERRPLAIEHIDICPIETLEEAGEDIWNKDECIQYLFIKLRDIKSLVEEDEEGTIYEFDLTDSTFARMSKSIDDSVFKYFGL